MRKIKFRVWNKRINQLSGCDDIYFTQEPLNEAFKFDEYVFMQYTGLKDINGKEIYEGDIVKTTNFIHMKTIYEIIWNEEVASFEYKDGPYINEYGDIIPGIHYPNECTVIGNIYENPELLERVK